MKGKGKLYSVVFTLTVFFFLFSILISATASAAQVTRIGNGSDPAIYGSKVVWTNDGVIHVYDLTARTDTTVNSSAASYPAIYEDKLVWHDESTGTPRLAVYNISTTAQTYIIQNVDQFSRPAIYGNRIVWSADYNETSYNYNVYMRDISTSTQTKIVEGNDPDIYETKITYGYEDDDGRNIVIYDVNTKETINLHHSSQVFSPHIYGNKVIWSDFYNRDGFIQMYDLVTKKTIDVTSDHTDNTLYGSDIVDAGADTGTHIDIYGEKIVYAKTGNDQFGSPGVYVYNISTGQSTQVTNYESGVRTTPDVYNNTVVWGIDNSFSGGAINDTGIYVSNLSDTDTLPPIANFTANVTSGTAPLVVLFKDTGTGGVPTSWLWDFGDGINSKHAMNATHTFTKPGTYNITLTVTNGAGNSSISKPGYITVRNSAIPDMGFPVADFHNNVTEGYAPLAVQFNDLSQNALSRAWDFNNDGSPDSSDLNPVYVYTAPGTYFVNLTISNANGISSAITTITVLKSGSSADGDSNGGGGSSGGSDGSGSDGSSSGGSSGGNGGGGAGGSPEPAKNVEVKELSQVYITSGKPVKFDFLKNATCVVYATFDAKKTCGKTTAIAEQLKEKSTLVSNISSGEVYKYFNLWVGNSGFATEKNIENPVICFKVDKSWLKGKNINQNSITLNRYSDKKWSQLPAKLLREDNKYLYFTAETPGFSFFAITGKALEKETVTETKAVTDTSEHELNNTTVSAMGEEQKPEKETDKEKVTSIPGLQAIYVVACLITIFLHRRK